jgi:hypothetical protein
MSFADVVRRGLERVIPSFPPRDTPATGWALPCLDLGLKSDPFADPDWREAVNSGANDSRRNKRPARRRATGRRT